MDNGIDICTRTELKTAIQAPPADGHINAYCDRKGVPRPGDVQPECTKVLKGQETLFAQTILAKLGQGNFAAPQAPSAGPSASGWTAVNSTSGNSDNTAVLLRMEKKINAFNASVTEIRGAMGYFAILMERVLKETGVDVSDIPDPFAEEEQL
jgi:hypothetical protein